MNEIFDVVYRSLKWLAKIVRLTYEEVNVIIWFFIIPVIFICLIDRILKTNYLKQGFALLVLPSVLVISNFEDFSKLVFQKSAAFLHWFDYLGINYTQASVLICVVLPILIIVLLLFLKRRKK